MLSASSRGLLGVRTLGARMTKCGKSITGSVRVNKGLAFSSAIFCVCAAERSKKVAFADAAVLSHDDIHDAVAVVEGNGIPIDNASFSAESSAEKWSFGFYLGKLFDFWRAMYRCGYLFMLFAPQVISSPLLLMKEGELTEMWWRNMRSTIAYAGPCIGKFAQWISLRTDLFPQYLCKNLHQLQNHSRVSSWTKIKSMLDKNLGDSWSERLVVEMEPDGQLPVVLGSGCVGQVIKGRFKQGCGGGREGTPDDSPDSEEMMSTEVHVANAMADVTLPVDRDVAIKLLHPGVRDVVELDLMILGKLSSWCEWFLPSVASTVSLLENVSEFSKLMRDQLNMTVEGGNLMQFRKNFGLPSHSERGSAHEHDLTVGFPCPILATADLLVEDFVHGLTLGEVLKKCDTETRKRMAAIGIHAVFKMVFVDNYIHADLHPGNILVTVDESHSPPKLKLSFIDTGLVVQLEKSDARNFVDLFRAVVTNNGYEAGQLMINRSRGQVPVRNKDEFSKEIQRIISNVHHSGFTLRELGLSDILQKVLHLCYSHQVKLESRFASVIVAIGIIEGVGRELDPDIDILKMAVPYVVKGAVKSFFFDFRHPSSTKKIQT